MRAPCASRPGQGRGIVLYRDANFLKENRPTMKKTLVPVLVAMLAFALLAISCSVSVDVDPPPPQGYDRQVVNTDSLNVRSCASSECDVVTVIHRGQWVRVYEYRSGWARIRVRDSGVEGWSDSRYISR